MNTSISTKRIGNLYGKMKKMKWEKKEVEKCVHYDYLGDYIVFYNQVILTLIDMTVDSTSYTIKIYRIIESNVRLIKVFWISICLNINYL